MDLNAFDFDIFYKPGLQNANADALSRIPYPIDTPKTADSNQCENVIANPDCAKTSGESKSPVPIDIAVLDSQSGDDVCLTEYHFEYGCSEYINALNEFEQLEDTEMATLQRQCPDLGYIIEFLETKQVPHDPKHKAVCEHAENQFVMKNGLLHKIHQPQFQNVLDSERFYMFQVAVPRCIRDTLLFHYHDNLAGGGHFGVSRTSHKLKQKFWFPKMHVAVKNYVASCDKCQRAKTDRHKRPPPLQPLPIGYTMSRIHIDILGPLPKTTEGHQYILLVIDSFSKWSEAFPLKTQSAQEIASTLYQQFICRYGAPSSMVSDRGRNFMSKIVSALCELFHIKRYHTSSYHPQSNSTVERVNSTLAKVLTTYVDKNQSNWSSLLPSIMMLFGLHQPPNPLGSPPSSLCLAKR